MKLSQTLVGKCQTIWPPSVRGKSKTTTINSETSALEDLFFKCLSFLWRRRTDNYTRIPAIISSFSFRLSISSGLCSPDAHIVLFYWMVDLRVIDRQSDGLSCEAVRSFNMHNDQQQLSQSVACLTKKRGNERVIFIFTPKHVLKCYNMTQNVSSNTRLKLRHAAF